MKSRYRQLIASGVMLGVGMGGFVDGIVFHQILQTHQMLTGVVPKVDLLSSNVNMFWDGLFHAFTWLMTAGGLVGLWHNVHRGDMRFSSRVFVGSLVLGWGLFNGVEGLVDHNLLRIHHVVERLGLSAFDHLFLASGILLAFGGHLSIQWGLNDQLGAPQGPSH